MNELDCKSLSDEDEYLLLENINDFADKAVTLLSTRKDSVE
jgi:hypothetical protein